MLKGSDYALIDLHLHLDGSLSPAAVVKMAQMSEEKLPTENVGELREMLSCPENCKDLNEYLNCFELPLKVMQNEKTIAYSVCDLVKRLEKQGLLYAEIRFAPQLHLRKGLTQKDVIEAAIRGLSEALAEVNMKAQLILCCMRGKGNEEENLETVKLTALYLGKGVAGCDIAGAEAIFPSSDYESLFKYACELGVPFTFHAGEASDSLNVLDGISFGAKRIGHGIRAYDDDATKKVINDNFVTLEICPTSNLQTKALLGVDNIKNYPLSKFFDSNVSITINTDNMTVSNTSLETEFQKLLDNAVITNEQAKQCVYNSVNAAFLSQDEKDELKLLCDERIK